MGHFDQQQLACLGEVVSTFGIGDQSVVADAVKAANGLRAISGFHRIRYYGLIANAERKVNLARVRELLNEPPDVEVGPESTDAQVSHVQPTFICRHCGAPMFIINTLVPVTLIRAPPQIRGTA